MEIRVLRYFLTVAREESITRAAQVLHITQPTLSRQLSQLEESMGVKLFLRERGELSLQMRHAAPPPGRGDPGAGRQDRAGTDGTG